MWVPPAALRSMAQRFAALEHAAKDDLDAGRRAQALDPAVLVLALDVTWLVLVPARLAPAWLCGGESPGVGEPQPGLGLEPPAGAERPRERSKGPCVTLAWRSTSLSIGFPIRAGTKSGGKKRSISAQGTGKSYGW